MMNAMYFDVSQLIYYNLRIEQVFLISHNVIHFYIIKKNIYLK
jgi:hypothetical protein